MTEKIPVEAKWSKIGQGSWNLKQFEIKAPKHNFSDNKCIHTSSNLENFLHLRLSSFPNVVYSTYKIM